MPSVRFGSAQIKVSGRDFVYPKIKSFSGAIYRFQGTTLKGGLPFVKERLQNAGYSVRTVYKAKIGIYIIYGRRK